MNRRTHAYDLTRGNSIAVTRDEAQKSVKRCYSSKKLDAHRAAVGWSDWLVPEVSIRTTASRRAE
ncbi:MAG TPA: hypothetical protein VIW07_09660 [Candidatus Udaeobacter sp.]